MDIVGYFLFGSGYFRFALNIQFHAPPQSELSSYALCVSSCSSPFAMSHYQYYYYPHYHYYYYHSVCDSDFSIYPNKGTSALLHALIGQKFSLRSVKAVIC